LGRPELLDYFVRDKIVEKHHLRTGALAIDLLMILLVLGGCMTVTPASRIIGIWDGQLHGFPIHVEYTQSTVGIGSKESVPYTIDGEVITLATENAQTYRVEFPSMDEMIQIDEVTDMEQKYTRRSPAPD
jgi:hypothetical protein